jgi:hypothetical protein
MRSVKRQRGAAMLLLVIAGAALLGVVGLALDASHLGYMKARLQATVDAMALSAAKRLDQVGEPSAACDAALEIMDANAEDFRELSDASPPSISCEYSASAVPFVSGSTPARYVRVRIAGLETGASLSRVLGFGTLEVTASAIAGPSASVAELCSFLPVAVCGSNTPPYYGFTPGNVYVLKGKKNLQEGKELGDFHLLVPGNDEGKLRQAFAGGYADCQAVPSQDVPINTGAKTGQVTQGVNTRFNEYKPSGQLDDKDYPPDVLIIEPRPLLKVDKFGTIQQGSNPDPIITGREIIVNEGVKDLRKTYLDRLKNPQDYDIPPLPAPGRGVLLRREVAVPIADCATLSGSSVNLIGAGCFFLLQKMGDGANASTLFGEFLTDCEAAGRPGSGGGTGGPYVIQLLRDPGSNDS